MSNPSTNPPERQAKRPLMSFDQGAVQARLEQGLIELKLALSAGRVAQLVQFLSVLNQANQIHNLTAIREPLEMVGKHVLDSLSVHPYLERGALIDIGAGGGLPSMPLVIAGVIDHALLIDSVGKKMRAVAEMAAAIGITKQIQTEHRRVEDVPKSKAQAQVISRAFASVDKFAALAGHLVSPDGALLAMKGVFPTEELANLEKPWRIQAHHPLTVPFVEGERCLLVIKRNVWASKFVE
jgi:16S rRNA (guanine527-N7)-methyltransferase